MPERTSAREHVLGALGVRHDRLLGELEPEPARRDAVPRSSRLGDVVREAHVQRASRPRTCSPPRDVQSVPAPCAARHAAPGRSPRASAAGRGRSARRAARTRRAGRARARGGSQRTSASAPTTRPVRRHGLGLEVQDELAVGGSPGRSSPASASRSAAVAVALGRVDLDPVAVPWRGTSRRRRGAGSPRARPSPARRRRRCSPRTWQQQVVQHIGSVERVSRRRGGRPGRRTGARPGSRTANSSPPRRASVSSRAAAAVRRAADRTSARSPTWWPSVSLTSLKRSRSNSSSADRGARLAPPRTPRRRARRGARGWAGR